MSKLDKVAEMNIFNWPHLQGKDVTTQVEINRRALLRVKDGRITTASTHTISQYGLQIICDWTKVYLLHPNGVNDKRNDERQMDVRLTLPLRDGLMEISANCNLTQIIPISQTTALVGLIFVSFEGNGLNVLQRFLNERNTSTTSSTL